MRESISNFRPRQQEDFARCLAPCFCLISFHFMLFSMPVSRPQRLFHVCDVFHGFDFVSFLFHSSRVFQIFFFHPTLLLVAVCAHLCAGDRGRSLFKVPWGELSPEALFLPYLRPSLLSPLPPRLDPAFKRSPTTPSLFSHDPAFRTQSQLPRIQSRELICHISEGENMRHTVMN